MTDCIVYNPDLVGVAKMQRSSALNGHAVAIATDTRKLITFDVTTLPLVITNILSLDAEPVGMTISDSLTWVSFRDGTLRSYSLATPPVEQSRTQLYFNGAEWMYAIGANMVLGNGAGTVLVRNTVTNAFTRAEGVLPNIVGGFAGGVAPYHYLFSGIGKGRVLTISETTGVIGVGNVFLSQNVVGHLSAQRNQALSELYTVSDERRIHFDISDPENPVVSEQENLFGTNPHEPGFIGGTTGQFTTADVPPGWYPHPWKQRGRIISIRAGAFTRGVYAGLYQVGAISLTNPTIADDGQVITL